LLFHCFCPSQLSSQSLSQLALERASNQLSPYAPINGATVPLAARRD
jgi:hypothetical protein